MYYNLITHISNNILCKYSEILVRDKIEVSGYPESPSSWTGFVTSFAHLGMLKHAATPVGWQQVNSLFRTAFCSCAIKC